MAVGDFGSTALLDSQFLTYTGFVPSNQSFRLVRGAGTTMFVGVSALEISSSDGAPQIVLGTYSISTAGVVSPTVITQAQLSSMANVGQATLDAIATDPPGVVIVAWTDRDNTAGDAAKISTYVVTPAGGLTFVQTASLQTDTDVSGVGTLSRVEGNVYLASYGFLISGISVREYGVSFSITTGGAITIPLDGPKQLATPSGSGAKHSAFVRTSHIINPYAGGASVGGIESHTMTVGGLFSGLPSEDQSSHGGTFVASHILTLDSGNGIVAFNHDNSSGDWLLKTALMDATGVLTTGHSTRMGATSIPAFSQLAYLGSRSLILLVDDASPSQLRTFVSDVNGTLTTVGTITNASLGRGPTFAHVSGNVMAVGTFVNGSTSSLRISTFNVANELTANTVPSIGIFIDLNADGAFTSTEDISTDCMRLSWRRGREAEQAETPIGTATIELKDPNADYNPLNAASKWGSTHIRVGKEVLTRVIFNTSTYNLFRGRIERISPQATPDAIRATLFVVDGMEELSRKFVSYPNSVTGATGGFNTSSGNRPIVKVIGTTVGAIAAVLDEASWGSTRRKLSEEGSTFTDYWTYGKTARAAITELEAQEFRGKIFIDQDGDVAFHAMDHNAGSTHLYHFNVAFQAWDHAFSARNIINAGAATVHGRDETTAIVLGTVAVNVLPTITVGTTLILTIPLSPAPTSLIFIPNILANSSEGSAAVGAATGTSYANTQVTITGQPLGASALRLRIANMTGVESVNIKRAELMTTAGYEDTNATLHVAGRPLNDLPWTSTASIADSIAAFGRRASAVDLLFTDKVPSAVDRSVNLATFYSTGKADFTKLSVVGSDTLLVEQLLVRGINDRIRVTSTGLKISTGRDYYITAGEYEMAPGNFAGMGLAFSAVYSLEEAT